MRFILQGQHQITIITFVREVEFITKIRGEPAKEILYADIQTFSIKNGFSFIRYAVYVDVRLIKRFVDR